MDLLNSTGVSELFGVSPSTFRKIRCETGDFPRPFLLGKTLFWEKSDILAYLEAKKVSPDYVLRQKSVE